MFHWRLLQDVLLFLAIWVVDCIGNVDVVLLHLHVVLESRRLVREVLQLHWRGLDGSRFISLLLELSGLFLSLHNEIQEG